MSCAIILNATSDKNIAASMVSILENTYQPKIICILTNHNTDSKQLEIAKSFLKSCCDGGIYSEEIASSNSNLKIFKINKNEKTYKQPVIESIIKHIITPKRGRGRPKEVLKSKDNKKSQQHIDE